MDFRFSIFKEEVILLILSLNDFFSEIESKIIKHAARLEMINKLLEFIEVA